MTAEHDIPDEWWVDEDGFNHREPHNPGDAPAGCPVDECTHCYNLHCAYYCPESRGDAPTD